MSNVTYPLDTTGISPENLVREEPHVLTESNDSIYRIIIPNFAPFYQDNLSIKYIDSLGVTKVFTKGIDYDFCLPYMDASRAIGKYLFGGITIHNSYVQGVVVLDYQTLGDKWVADKNYVLETLVENNYNLRTAYWDQLTNVQQTFPPTSHAQDYDTIYGQKSVVESFDKLIETILKGPNPGIKYFEKSLLQKTATLEELKESQAVEKIIQLNLLLESGLIPKEAKTTELFAAIDSTIEESVSRSKTEITKESLGLGLVSNTPLASLQEVESSFEVDKLLLLSHLLQSGLIPREAKTTELFEAVDAAIETAVTRSKTEITKESLGLGLVQNLSIATDVELQNSTPVDKLFTLKLLLESGLIPKEAKTAELFAAIDTAIETAVTRAKNEINSTDIDLSNITLFPTASLTELQTSTPADKLITLKLLLESGLIPKEAQTVELYAAIEAAIETAVSRAKTEIAAGGVDISDISNLPTATLEELQQLSFVDKLITLKLLLESGLIPKEAKTAELFAAIDTAIDTAVSRAKTEITKTSLGLGLVENLATASFGELQNSTKVDKLITLKLLLESGLIPKEAKTAELFAAIDAAIETAVTRAKNEIAAEGVDLNDITKFPTASLTELQTSAPVDKLITLKLLLESGLIPKEAETVELYAAIDAAIDTAVSRAKTEIAAAGVDISDISNLPTATLTELQTSAPVDKLITLKLLLESGLIPKEAETAAIYQAIELGVQDAITAAVEQSKLEITRSSLSIDQVSNFGVATETEFSNKELVDKYVLLSKLLPFLEQTVPVYAKVDEIQKSVATAKQEAIDEASIQTDAKIQNYDATISVRIKPELLTATQYYMLSMNG